MLAPSLADSDAKYGSANTAKSAKSGQQSHRAGDWICVKCNNLNYSFRNKCNRCQVQTKKQNLLDNLLLINSEQDSPQVADENFFVHSDNKLNAKAASFHEHFRRVPFGDITNFSASSEPQEGLKKPLRLPKKKDTAGPESWTPFSNNSKSIRKLSGGKPKEEGLGQPAGEQKKDGFLGFDSVLLLHNSVETPKKERAVLDRETELCQSPENVKHVTKFLFDSEQKNRREQLEKETVVSSFDVHAEKKFIDVLFDILHSDPAETRAVCPVQSQLRSLN